MAASKHILVLGATGRQSEHDPFPGLDSTQLAMANLPRLGASGLEFIKAVLGDPSKHVTLLTRSVSKLPQEYLSHGQISVVQGQLNDPVAVGKAMEGVTSVVSFLGAYITLANFLTRSTDTPIADSLQTVFAAMRAAGVKRLMALSTPGGFQQPGERPSWLWWLLVHVIPKLVTPGGVAEMRRIGEVVSAQKDLDWTVFRIPHLNEGSKDLEVRTGFIGAGYDGSWELSRASLVRWVLRELDEGKWTGRAPAVGNA
ncbi:uncharacterized protein PV09_03915 [Verruconis gallopava]|uniref:NAD(P)-binding domain-containing protein n=1 Tax=Verruconis gallopava TaxID=253628 RepID=A0A0D1YXH1_9PEZI|nr:uncharacterized protein PV09_03915 [Verruconis gallopava]KIW05402.1 hypothetical protein PV09_03915 [Verruconis gallopava]